MLDDELLDFLDKFFVHYFIKNKMDVDERHLYHGGGAKNTKNQQLRLEANRTHRQLLAMRSKILASKFKEQIVLLDDARRALKALATYYEDKTITHDDEGHRIQGYIGTVINHLRTRMKNLSKKVDSFISIDDKLRGELDAAARQLGDSSLWPERKYNVFNQPAPKRRARAYDAVEGQGVFAFGGE